MRYLVTGATGFVGSNIALELASQGHEVIAVGSRNEQALRSFSGKLIKKKFYDLSQEELGKVDGIFHQAAITGMLSPAGKVYNDKSEFFRVNTKESLKLFKKAIKNGCKRIIYASSCSVYGHSKAPFIEGQSENPNSYYGESKLELDKRALDLANENPDVTIVGLRYSNVFGPRENHKGKSANIIYQIAQQMLTGNPKLFKNGEQLRDEIYIKDVVRANLLALKAKESCVVNCGSGIPTNFNKMVEILNKVMRQNKKTEYIDNPYKEFFQDHTECDMSLAKEKLGFVPKWSFENAMQDYFKEGWLQKPPIKSSLSKI
jgi:ADP-L-glycero-D-manno-heptose 6-epimerase